MTNRPGQVAALAATLMLGFGGASSVAPAASAGDNEVQACPSRMPEGQASLTCGCTAQAVTEDVSVWGVGAYTDDSGLCRAALHAGAVRRGGGVIAVHRGPGRPSYPGGAANGVTSQSYAAWPRTITFDNTDSSVMATADMCPTNATAMRGTQRAMTCECPAGAATGTVWGSGPYTDDSNICTAARHAGLIGDGGGMISLRPVAGRNSYRGSTANGVTTSNYGGFGGSYILSAPR